MIPVEAKTYISEQLLPKFENKEANRLAKWLLEDIDFHELSIQHLQPYIARLLNGEPIQYVTGQASFYGRMFEVSPDVLIPRPETEELVYECFQRYKNKTNFSILDVGTGSGCIPITIKKKYSNWTVSAIDVSEAALNIARKNAIKFHVNIEFQQLNFLDKSTTWKNLPQVDLVISNPPYIPNEEKKVMSRNVIDFEPSLALFVDDHEPLIFYQALAEYATSIQADVLCELNEFYSLESKQLFKQYFKSVELIEDMQGKSRMLLAQG